MLDPPKCTKNNVLTAQTVLTYYRLKREGMNAYSCAKLGGRALHRSMITKPDYKAGVLTKTPAF